MISSVVATAAASSINHGAIATVCKSTTSTRTRARDVFSSTHSFCNLPTTTTSMAFASRNRQIICYSATSRSTVVTGEVGEAGREENEDEESSMVGRRVRVKVPLKVYHVPRVPEMDLAGLEGNIKQFVGVWKGKRISANLPFKVEFVVPIEGRGPVKFFAHLKDDEFEFIH